MYKHLIAVVNGPIYIMAPSKEEKEGQNVAANGKLSTFNGTYEIQHIL